MAAAAVPYFGSPPRKAAGLPLLIGAEGASRRLDEVDVDKATHPEAWLQEVAFEHPAVLPVTDIEPGFGAIYAVAREVPCGHGYIDNLYITATGDIVLVEAKLWRNHQARREVVAQALDYVAALMGMGFEVFEAACHKGQGMSAPSLHDLIAAEADALDEQDFIDAVRPQPRARAHGGDPAWQRHPAKPKRWRAAANQPAPLYFPLVSGI